MSVVDFRHFPSGQSHVHAEPELRVRGRLPSTPEARHVDLCETFATMLALVGGMSANDVRIVEAVCRSGSVRGAAKALEPERPSYRAYIQRRMKQLRARLDATSR